MTLDEFQKYLNNFLNLEKSRNVTNKNDIWLDNTRLLCKQLNNPENSYKIIHIAGSKGKGSTATLCSNILKAAGCKCGLYLSPHVTDFRERVTISGEFLPNNIYEEAADKVVDAVKKISSNFKQIDKQIKIPCNDNKTSPNVGQNQNYKNYNSKIDNVNNANMVKQSLCRNNISSNDNVNNRGEDATYFKCLKHIRNFTWFELVTVFAFECFKIARCDWVVLEVGMGGLLDCTNVVTPVVSVITSIELEHTEFLGNTISKIATQKAGIIKKNAPCVIGRQRFYRATEVFRKKCSECNSTIYEMTNLTQSLISKKYDGANNSFMQTIKFNIKDLDIHIDTQMKLLGEQQRDNAITAAIATKIALPGITNKNIEDAFLVTTLPARFQIFFSSNSNFIVVDGAHTPRSIAYTIKTMKKLSKKPFDVLFACSNDKNVKDIAKNFSNAFNITITNLPNKRSCDPLYIQKIFRRGDVISDPIDAFKKASATSNNLLVVGSFYLAAVILKNIKVIE